jgi:hypothetical protein
VLETPTKRPIEVQGKRQKIFLTTAHRLPKSCIESGWDLIIDSLQQIASVPSALAFIEFDYSVCMILRK